MKIFNESKLFVLAYFVSMFFVLPYSFCGETENIVEQVAPATKTSESITFSELDPAKTAIIVIDMWNFHWCMTASERVAAMVPRMNAVLEIARKQGMQVIWNPSDVVAMYSGYPQYEKAIAVKVQTSPKLRNQLTTKFTAKVGDCLCGPGINCKGNYGWDGMNPNLEIKENDLFSASTNEIYSLLSERGITDIIYMGVHTNMCVYGKPGALSSMYQAGFRCWLARDLNDAFTNYNPSTGFTPDNGTMEIDHNLQVAGVPNINLGEEYLKAGLLKRETPLDFVRFVPWGKPERPYFFENNIVVTLTSPWLDGTEIRYTTDGSEPTADSELYSQPLEIAKTTSIRAAAFRNKTKVSLLSNAQYILLPPKPVLPDVFLDDLEYIPESYGLLHSSWFWFPKKQKSFEGKPLRVRGTTYQHGLGFRAPASVQYELKPEYKRFVALAGVDENLLSQNNGCFFAMHSSVVFKIFIDGKLVSESPAMRISQEPWRFDVEIPEGSRRLSMSCTDAGSRHLLDYGNWLDAGFIVERK
ncbi:MAG: isochorismatase family protein [Planctomycetaceae bacterium]|jgi:nicotinamidase-related amidase|nr:isochorismatase family protein [Planctomycetaceae bacterium]